MDLHQIQLTYQPADDRILCRTSFKADDGSLQEVRAWLTRRMTRELWGGLLTVMERQVALDKPHAAHASGDIVGMEHHATIDEMRENGGFDSTFEDGAVGFPLGAEPILVTTVNFAQDSGQPIRMNLLPQDGDGFEIACPPQILHGFCSLLRDAANKGDWDLELELPGSMLTGSGTLN